MRWFISLFLLLCLMGLCSCASAPPTNTTEPSKLAVIYTSAAQSASRLVFLNRLGEVNRSVPLQEGGIFHLEQNPRGELILPVQYGNHLIYLDRKGQSRKQASLLYPLFVKEAQGIRIATYNTELNAGTLEMKQANQTHRVKLPGFLRVATFDEHHVYVFATIIHQKKPVLYVLDRNRASLIQTLPLQIDLANDMEIIHGHCVLTSVDAHRQIAVVSLKDWSIRYIDVPYGQPEFILPQGDSFYLTYQNQTKLSVIDADTWQPRSTATLKHPVFRADADSEHLYVLTPLDQSDHAGGIISVYDKKTFRYKGNWTLPKERELLVQDLAVLRSETGEQKTP
jgi:hypothetical protein